VSGSDDTQLIDTETWAYIARLDATYPPDAVDLSTQSQRRIYNEMCRIFD
jgi:acetyl esterase